MTFLVVTGLLVLGIGYYLSRSSTPGDSATVLGEGEPSQERGATVYVSDFKLKNEAYYLVTSSRLERKSDDYESWLEPVADPAYLNKEFLVEADEVTLLYYDDSNTQHREAVGIETFYQVFRGDDVDREYYGLGGDDNTRYPFRITLTPEKTVSAIYQEYSP